METLLLIVYAALLLLQAVLLVRCILRPKPLLWGILLGIETLTAAGAYFLMRHFDNLPGTGKAPGLTYFGETLFSLGAAIAYSVMLGITLAAGAIVFLWLQRKK